MYNNGTLLFFTFWISEMYNEIERIRTESTKRISQVGSNAKILKAYSSHAYDLSRLRVLCVDDNKNMHAILKTMFFAMNIKNVQFCDDPPDAFLLMRTWLPDIIIADLEMPLLNGFELIRFVRQAPDSPDPYIPIIVLTAHTDKTHVLAARDAGANAIIAKPVSTLMLYGRLVRLIEDPVPFIKTKDYFGPDRRRLDLPYDGPERRSQDGVPIDL